MNNFAKNLKQLRIQQRLTINQLAKILEVTPYTLSSWEKGKTKPNLNKLITIVKIFNTTCNSILGL